MELLFRLSLLLTHRYTRLIELAVKTCCHILRELYSETLSHILHSSLKAIFPSWLAVRVSTDLTTGGYGARCHIIPRTLKKRVVVESHRKSIPLGYGDCLNKLLLQLLANLLARLLLQDNQVASDFSSCLLAKHT